MSGRLGTGLSARPDPEVDWTMLVQRLVESHVGGGVKATVTGPLTPSIGSENPVIALKTGFQGSGRPKNRLVVHIGSSPAEDGFGNVGMTKKHLVELARLLTQEVDLRVLDAWKKMKSCTGQSVWNLPTTERAALPLKYCIRCKPPRYRGHRRTQRATHCTV